MNTNLATIPPFARPGRSAARRAQTAPAPRPRSAVLLAVLLSIPLALFLAAPLMAPLQAAEPGPQKMAELQQKAEAGDAEAMGELAKAFWYGDGVQKSEPSALRWYEKAGAAGDVESMMRLGDIYLNGFSADGKDYNEARFWYEKAAAAGSDAAVRAAANTGIGRVLINLNRHDQAFPYLSKAATAGDMEAQCFLGHLYYNGRGTSRDQAAGRRWVEKAVAQGMSYCPKL